VRVAILTTDNRDHHRKYHLPVPEFGPAIEALLEGLFGRPELELHVISCTQRPMAAPEKLGENAFFHLLEVPKIGWLRTGYQGCIRAIRRRLREISPSLVHGQGTERECGISAAFSGFPNVITIHGNMRNVARAMRARPPSYLWATSILESFTISRAGGVFCNSAYTQRQVENGARRTWRVPNPLRSAFFDTPANSSFSRERPIFLNIGTILPYKNQVEILKMMSNLHAQGFFFEMHFIGDIPRSRYSAEFSELLKKAPYSEFARHVSVSSLSELINAIDSSAALLHASSEESFGLVVAEALTRGRKLFAMACGGVPDIASEVEGAELFPPDDWKRMGQALSAWMQRNCPQPAGTAAIMAARYHPRIVAQQHVEIYRQILANNSAK
jgi:glycosyltransferase involved in cell wall biosynthesis